jgi:hypothetical protein
MKVDGWVFENSSVVTATGDPDPHDLKNLKSFVVPETVSRPSSLSVDEEFRTNYRCNAFFEVLVNDR